MAAWTGSLSGLEVVTLLSSTVFIDVIAYEYYLDRAEVGSETDEGTKTDVLAPVAAINGWSGESSPDFADLWYNHFHILPNRISLGNLISTQIRPIEFWNGYFTSFNVNSVAPTDLNGVALDLAGVTTFAALESKYRNLSIETVGAPTFDGFFTIVGNDGKTYYLYVTGQRVLVIPFQHNWSTKVVERLAWLNNSTKSLDGIEQIVGLRDKPRRTIDYDFLLASTQNNAGRLQNLFKALMYGWQSRIFIVPVWTDATRLQADAVAGQKVITVPTTYFDYDVGSYILLWKDEETYEVVEIDSMTAGSITVTVDLLNTWPAKTTVVMPARQGYINQNLQGTLHTTDIGSVPVSFEFLAQNPSLNRLVGAALPTYRGYPVLITKNDFAGSHNFAIEKDAYRNDAGIGLFSIEEVQATPDYSNSFGYLFANHAEAANYFHWLDGRKGRQGVFWQPTWSHDMEVQANIGAMATAFVIKNIEYTRLYYIDGAPAYNRRDVMIRLKNGSVYYRRITGVTLDAGANTETIGMDSALGVLAAVSEIDRVSFLIPSALKADAVELSWASGNVSQSQVVIADVYNGSI